MEEKNDVEPEPIKKDKTECVTDRLKKVLGDTAGKVGSLLIVFDLVLRKSPLLLYY